jgi:hypothetical protein
VLGRTCHRVLLVSIWLWLDLLGVDPPAGGMRPALPVGKESWAETGMAVLCLVSHGRRHRSALRFHLRPGPRRNLLPMDSSSNKQGKERWVDPNMMGFLGSEETYECREEFLYRR